MNNSFINIDKLPDIVDLPIKAEEELELKRIRLIKNYNELININMDNLNDIIDKYNNKSFVIYNLGMLIELLLKMILLKYNLCSLEKICESKHIISEMFKRVIDNCNDKNVCTICEEIKDIITHIKSDNGNNINFNEYMNYRYNHMINDYELLCTNSISSNDLKYIKEVLRCIKSIM